MRRLMLVLGSLAVGSLVVPALGRAVGADDVPPAPSPTPAPALSPTEIDWRSSVPQAFEEAKKANKPVFVAINADRVDGKGRMEPAGLMLRETTYHDAQVVARSRLFVCVLVKSDAAGADNDELRAHFDVTERFVSPQHLFAYADGTQISRKEYWEPKDPASSASTLLGLMQSALDAQKAKAAGSAASGGTPEEKRAAWIRELIAKVQAGSADKSARDAAIRELVRGDQKGDCIDPLCTAMLGTKKDPDTVVAILKAIGRPGLEIAVPAVLQALDDREDEVRSNAAVTLEYIGSARAVDPLTKRLAKEKDEFAFNNCCRALGRCGAKQEAVRKTLVHELTTAKNDKTAAGPAIGLAYFEKDPDAARAVEKQIDRVDWQKRTFLVWTLTEIGDPKSADFLRDKVIKNEKNQLALGFLNAAHALLAGGGEGAGQKEAVDGGLSFAIGSVGGVGGEARRGREDAQGEWKPKGEVGRAPGGGPGKPPDKPGDKSGMGGN